MKKRVFDEQFKHIAIELSEAKGSVKEAAEELGIDPGRLSKWRIHYKKNDLREHTQGFSEEQKEIRRLQKELREVQMERDILKKAVSLFSRGERNGLSS